MHADMNSLEDYDYWEDASVSVGCSPSCHSWGLPLHSKVSHMQLQPLHVPSPSRPRIFPPPLALCATLSIKEGGRFVLKEMTSVPPQGFFRAVRGHGRLRLHFIDIEHVDEEDDRSNEDNVCGSQNPSVCIEHDAAAADDVCGSQNSSVCVRHDLHERKDGYEALYTKDVDSSNHINEIAGVYNKHVLVTK